MFNLSIMIFHWVALGQPCAIQNLNIHIQYCHQDFSVPEQVNFPDVQINTGQMCVPPNGKQSLVHILLRCHHGHLRCNRSWTCSVIIDISICTMSLLLCLSIFFDLKSSTKHVSSFNLLCLQVLKAMNEASCWTVAFIWRTMHVCSF